MPGLAIQTSDPALLTPATEFAGHFLPIRSADGSTPAERYRSRAGLPAHRPEVAILLEGIGLATDMGERAVDTLPPAVSLAVSPYAPLLERDGPPALLDRARRNGHELWLSLPMEPSSSTADEGGWALRRSADQHTNRRALEWSLSRFTGYVGLTNAGSGLFGDDFAGSPGFSLVSDTLLRRGLLYVEGGEVSHDGSALPPPRSSRRADLVLDGRAEETEMNARLLALERLATEHGTAVAIAGPVSPLLLDRLRSWSHDLDQRGLALVPVSALTPDPVVPSPPPPSSDPAPSAEGSRPP